MAILHVYMNGYLVGTNCVPLIFYPAPMRKHRGFPLTTESN